MHLPPTHTNTHARARGPHPKNRAQVTLEACAYASTGDVLHVQVTQAGAPSHPAAAGPAAAAPPRPRVCSLSRVSVTSHTHTPPLGRSPCWRSAASTWRLTWTRRAGTRRTRWGSGRRRRRQRGFAGPGSAARQRQSQRQSQRCSWPRRAAATSSAAKPPPPLRPGCGSAGSGPGGNGRGPGGAGEEGGGGWGQQAGRRQGCKSRGLGTAATAAPSPPLHTHLTPPHPTLPPHAHHTNGRRWPTVRWSTCCSMRSSQSGPKGGCFSKGALLEGPAP